ncbi:MAG: hypothetical protein WCP30_19200 [Mycobacteriaceae bacterium]
MDSVQAIRDGSGRKAAFYPGGVDGERVRASALQVTTAGASWLACEHRWAPDGFVELARRLGVMPDNVLE